MTVTARTTISDIAVARSTRNGAKKGDRVAFLWFLPVSRRVWQLIQKFASAPFFVWCRSPPIIAFLRDQACCARLPGRRATASNITHSKLLAGPGAQASHESFVAVDSELEVDFTSDPGGILLRFCRENSCPVIIHQQYNISVN